MEPSLRYLNLNALGLTALTYLKEGSHQFGEVFVASDARGMREDKLPVLEKAILKKKNE